MLDDGAPPEGSAVVATILVIEDTPANRALATKLLQAAGHDVFSADTAADGMAWLARSSPTWCSWTSGSRTWTAGRH